MEEAAAVAAASVVWSLQWKCRGGLEIVEPRRDVTGHLQHCRVA